MGPHLERKILKKIRAICLIYIFFGFLREAVLSFRHSHYLSVTFNLLGFLPVSLLNGVIFYWILTALSELMETLKARHQDEKLRLFHRFWNILVLTLTLAAFGLVAQVFD